MQTQPAGQTAIVQTASIDLFKGMADLSDPDSLDFAETDVIIAAIVEAGGFGVGMPGHALRDFDPAAVGQVIGDPGRAEGMATDRRHLRSLSCRKADNGLLGQLATRHDAALRRHMIKDVIIYRRVGDLHDLDCF